LLAGTTEALDFSKFNRREAVDSNARLQGRKQERSIQPTIFSSSARLD
jgi:hypothetical protein